MKIHVYWTKGYHQQNSQQTELAKDDSQRASKHIRECMCICMYNTQPYILKVFFSCVVYCKSQFKRLSNLDTTKALVKENIVFIFFVSFTQGRYLFLPFYQMVENRIKLIWYLIFFTDILSLLFSPISIDIHQ